MSQEVTISWDDVSTERPPPLDAGIYAAEIVEADATTSKSGNPSLRLVFCVTHPLNGTPGSLERKVYRTEAVTEKTAFRLKQLSLACGGLDLPSRISEDSLRPVADELVGKNLFLRIKQEQDQQGEWRHTADAYLDEAKAQEAAAAAGANGAASNGSPPARRSRRR